MLPNNKRLLLLRQTFFSRFCLCLSQPPTYRPTSPVPLPLPPPPPHPHPPHPRQNFTDSFLFFFFPLERQHIKTGVGLMLTLPFSAFIHLFLFFFPQLSTPAPLSIRCSTALSYVNATDILHDIAET